MATSKTGPTIILVTGPPGIGKTTLIRRVCEALGGTPPAPPSGPRRHPPPPGLAGFYTEEVRAAGAGPRLGFDVVCLRTGERAPLARVPRGGGGGGGGAMLGRYRVDVGAFEGLALRTLEPTNQDGAAPLVHVIDEVGKMELMSAKFESRVRSLIAPPLASSQLVLLATIPIARGRGLALVEEMKRLRGAQLIEVSRENRNDLISKITQEIQKEIGHLPG